MTWKSYMHTGKEQAKQAKQPAAYIDGSLHTVVPHLMWPWQPPLPGSKGAISFPCIDEKTGLGDLNEWIAWSYTANKWQSLLTPDFQLLASKGYRIQTYSTTYRCTFYIGKTTIGKYIWLPVLIWLWLMHLGEVVQQRQASVSIFKIKELK